MTQQLHDNRITALYCRLSRFEPRMMTDGMVNGGNAQRGLIGGAKFNVGDKVVVKSAPDGGIGTVVKSQYDKGWKYTVRIQGGTLTTFEGDLEPALL